MPPGLWLALFSPLQPQICCCAALFLYDAYSL